jgi:GntR family transcriptional regulator, rspAB operon transcriptional repressor
MSEARMIRTIREQVVERLRADVLSGRIAAGAPLREVQLAERFGISRGPIRDALLQLTQEGLLVSRPNRGVRVGRAPADAIQPLLFELRRKIEVSALRSVFDRLDDDHEELGAILEGFQLACEREEMSEVVEHDMKLHRWIVERPGDPDLLAIWLSITVRMRLMYTRHHNLMESYREHEAVVDAIRRRDEPAAVHALEANIRMNASDSDPDPAGTMEGSNP